MSNEGERAVVVTTEYRGVFFGYATAPLTNPATFSATNTFG